MVEGAVCLAASSSRTTDRAHTHPTGRLLRSPQKRCTQARATLGTPTPIAVFRHEQPARTAAEDNSEIAVTPDLLLGAIIDGRRCRRARSWRLSSRTWSSDDCVRPAARATRLKYSPELKMRTSRDRARALRLRRRSVRGVPQGGEGGARQSGQRAHKGCEVDRQAERMALRSSSFIQFIQNVNY